MSRIGLAPVLLPQKELSSLRSHYQHAFVRLIKISQVGINQVELMSLIPRQDMYRVIHLVEDELLSKLK